MAQDIDWEKGTISNPAGSEPDWESGTISEQNKPRTRGLFEAVNDNVIEFANAAAGGVSALANMVKPGNAVSSFIDENIIKAGEQKQSDVVQGAKRQLSEGLQSAQGIGDEVGAVGSYVLNNPLLAASQAAGSFALPGGAVKGAGAAAKALGAGAKGIETAGRVGGIAAGAAMAGGDAAGTAYDLASKAGATEDQAVAAGRQASVIPALVGGVTGAFGAERLLAGAKGFGGNALSRGLKSGLSEAGQEAVEEGVTQFEGQRAAMPYDESIDPTKGVAGAAAMGGIMGFGPGAVLGAMGGGPELPSKQMGIDPSAGPLSRAAASAVDSQPVPSAGGMGFNPDAGATTVFPDGSQSMNSEMPAAPVMKEPQPQGPVASGQVRKTYADASKDWVAGGKLGDVIREGGGFRFVAEGSPELEAWRTRFATKQQEQGNAQENVAPVLAPQAVEASADVAGNEAPTTDGAATEVPGANSALRVEPEQAKESPKPVDPVEPQKRVKPAAVLRDMAEQFRERFKTTQKETDRTFAVVLDEFAADIESGKRDPATVESMKQRYAEILATPATKKEPVSVTAPVEAEQASEEEPQAQAPRTNKLKEARDARRAADELRGTAGASTVTGGDITPSGVESPVADVRSAGRNDDAGTAQPDANGDAGRAVGSTAEGSAALRPDGWRTTAIKAGKVARSLGLDPKGKRLKEIVAEIDAVDAGSGVAAKPDQQEAQEQPKQEQAKPTLTKEERQKAIDAETMETRKPVQVAQPTPMKRVSFETMTLSGPKKVNAKLYELPGYEGPQIAVAEYKTSRGTGYKVYLPKSGAFITDSNGVSSLKDTLELAVLRIKNARETIAKRQTANVQNTPSSTAGTEAKAAPVEASTPARGDAASNGAVSAAGQDAGVRADGVANGPGSDAGNGFKRGPQDGERYRVGVVDSVGGAVSLEKRLPAGTSATFYVGKDGGLVDGESVNLIGQGLEKLWIPTSKDAADQATVILDEMGKLALSDPKRADLKKRLKQLVTGAGDVQADGVKKPKKTDADRVIKRLASTSIESAPDDVLESAKAFLESNGYQNIRFVTVDGDERHSVAAAVARSLGKTYTVYRPGAGSESSENITDGLSQLGGKHIFVSTDVDNAPLKVAFHEVYHSLPDSIRKPLNEQLFSYFKPGMKDRFIAENNGDEEEAAAHFADAISTRMDFWESLKSKLGKSEFGKIVNAIIKTFDAVVDKLTKSKDSEFLSEYIADVEAARDALAQAYADAYKSAQAEKPAEDDARSDQTKTPAFKKWFGASKVVDESGNPMVMYHGTSNSEGGNAFTMFDAYGSNYGLFGQGAYFTNDPEVASSYTSKGKGGTPTVYSAFMSIKSPVDMDAKADPAAWEAGYPEVDFETWLEDGDTNESYYRAAEEHYRDAGYEKWEGAEAMQDGLRRMGFDGITHIGGGRVKSEGKKHRVFIAFDPEQIKSAIGNNGTFDPESPDIRLDAATGDSTATTYTPASDAHQKAVTAFADRLSKNRDSFVLMDAVKPSGARAKEAQSVSDLAKTMFGREVVFVKFKGRPLFNGAVSTTDPGKIFVNIESARPMMAVLGHELLHELRKSNPAAYNQLAKTLKTVTKDDYIYEALLKKKYRDQGLNWTPQDISEELYGDIVGDNFMDPKFWEAIAGDKPIFAKQLYRAVMNWLDKISSMFKRVKVRQDGSMVMTLAEQADGSRPFGTQKYLKDIEAARAAVAQAMGQFGKTKTQEQTDALSIADAVEQIGKQAAVKPVVQALNDTFKVRGKIHWWHKTVGTPFNLAERVPEFKRVFNSVQDFINSVSFYGAEAAAMAPKIIPKLESWKDLGKSPIKAEDNKAIAAPIFEGTLSWRRGKNGVPVQTDDVGEAGIVWTDDELRSKFKLSDEQIGLYREFRAATDKSLTDLALSDILQFAGKDAEPIKDTVMGMSLKEGSETVIRYLKSLAEGEDKVRKAMLFDTANSIKDKADKAQNLMDRGYAPLQRFGRHTLYATNEKGEQLFFGMYEDRWAAARAARQMREQYPGSTVEVGMMSEQSYKMFQGISPETLELFGTMLGLDTQADGQTNEAFQTYLKLAKSNRSALKRLIERKGISGYSEDASRVLASYIYSNARQTASNLHVGEIMNGVNDIPRSMGEAKDAAVKLARYTMDPQEEAQALRGLLFAQYLGGSIASAAINALQPAQVTFPYLSQFVGAKKSASLMTGAVRDALKKSTGDPRLDAELKKAEEEGIVSPQEIFQLMAQAQGKATLKAGDGTKAGDAMAAASNTLSRLSLGWGKVFSIPEQFNRRTTFIAAYRAAKETGESNPYEFAKQAVKETQLVYNKGNRPEWARGTIGALAFTFKTYSISYVELLQRMAASGPEGRRAAMLMVGVLFVMAGAGGLPGVEDAEDVVDGIAQRVFGLNFQTRQKRQEWLADTFGDGGARFIENGLSGLPWSPTDVSGRLGLGNLIPGTGVFVKKDDYGRDVAELAGPAADMTKRFLEGAGLLLQGEVLKAGEIVSPTAVRNMIQGGRMLATDQYTDTKGRKVIDTTPAEGITKLIGFQPADVARVQEATGTMQRMIALNKIRESEIADKWAKGLASGDAEQVQEARDELRKWNESNPESPIRINMPQLFRRVRALKEDKATRIARTAPKEIRQDVRRALEQGQ